MPVSEYGEIGRLVHYYPESGDLVLWAVSEVEGNRYWTSCGWVRGKPEEYFAPIGKERSLRPCILRASKYIEAKYPGKSYGTH